MTIDIKRRMLLQGTAAAAGMGLVPGFGVIRSASSATSPTTIVVINLDGGNDTLNTVIPYANPEYYRLRASLAIPSASSLKLDAQNAFHPVLTGLKSLWDRQRVAIVHGVGYPGFNYSHFQSKQIYWTADPGLTWRMGWLGRAVDAMIAANPNLDVLAGVTLSAETRPLQGQRFVPVQVGYNSSWFSFGAEGAGQTTALRQLMSLPATATNPLCNRIYQGSQTALRAYDKVHAGDSYVPSTAYPTTTLGLNLKMVAQLISGDPNIRVVALNHGDFDTHTNQLAKHATQLSIVDASIKAFTDDLDLKGLSNQVLILLTSDFGRRVLPNWQAGTDHGAAQTMMLIGPAVKAGILGVAPPLTAATLINNGNLPMQVDFRTLYTTLLSGWLGINPAAALGGFTYPTLPVLL